MSAKLGEIIVRENILSSQQLREALDFQRENGGCLGFSLVKPGLISDGRLKAFAFNYSLAVLPLLVIALSIITAPVAQAQSRTALSVTPGASRSYSTIYSIGVEWDVSGDANHNAAVQVEYCVQGSATSNTVTLNVNPVNDAPSAVNDSATTMRNTPLTITLLANNSDPDGDLLKVRQATQGSKGYVTVNASQTVTYAPGRNFNKGTDTFTYTISDGRGGTAAGVVSVRIK